MNGCDLISYPDRYTFAKQELKWIKNKFAALNKDKNKHQKVLIGDAHFVTDININKCRFAITCICDAKSSL